MGKGTCIIDGCPQEGKKRGRCNAHYLHWRRRGDEHGDTPFVRPTCPYPGCGNPVDSRGHCASHARQLREGTDLHTLKPFRVGECSIEDCPDLAVGNGLCNKHYIRVRLHGDAYHERRPEDAPRKYALNKHFFDEIDTEVKAYWLGFVTADGGIARSRRTNTLRVGLQLRDASHLERMNADLGSDRPLLYYRERAHPAVTAQFDCWTLVESLGRLGVGPQKSGRVEPWVGPEHLMRHYWRGLFDGDGSIHHRGRQWHVNIAGSAPCVSAFAAWARRICGSTARERLAKGRTWEWTVGGGPKPQRLVETLYAGSTVALPRKLDLAEQLIALIFHSQRRTRQ